MIPLLLRDVEVDGRRVDVSVLGGTVAAVGARLEPPAGAEVIEGGGGALLPGLWDHHIHLLALAAARRSVPVGPPAVTSAAGLADALRGAAGDPDGWVRAVGYHESVAGELDRYVLDRLVPGTAARVQHRSGALWVLSDAAVRRLGLDDIDAPGLERDANGRATGRIFGGDRWLRDHIAAVAPEPPPDLEAIGRELAGYGVVGVSDATPAEGLDDLELLARAASSGALPQHVVTMGGPALAGAAFPTPLLRGPVKLLLADHSLPGFDPLVAWIERAHQQQRPVAVHCVTRSSLALTLAALDEAGHLPGDRIEHGAVVPPELRVPLAAHQLTVVTQPNFVAERGDQYRTDVERDDRPHLYPCRGLLEAGVPVAGSTDAPFGHPDPWRAIDAAVERRTGAGHVLGAEQRVDGPRALALFLGRHDDPGGRPREVAPGAPADLCLLHGPLAEQLAAPRAERVRLTIIAGQLVHGG